MLRTLTRLMFTASLGLGLSWSSAQATHPGSSHPYAPRYQPCPPVIVPYTPTEKRPSDLPPGETTPQPDVTQPAMPTAPEPAAESIGGGGVGMLGRGDQNQRFNLFDHMAAIPQTRAWFGFQYMKSYTTGVFPTQDFLSFYSISDFSDLADVLSDGGLSIDIITDRKIFLYRAGAEVALSSTCSIAVQWEYFTVNGEVVEDGFSNPQVLGKYLLYQGETCAVSATLGFLPETSIDAFEFKENHSRIYPGALFLSNCGDFILQGGIQFGIPLKDDQLKTFDWAISLGYWLYRNPSYCDQPYGCGQYGYGYGHGCGMGCGHGCGLGGGIMGIIPQIELLGKHVLGDATTFSAFDFPTTFDPTPGSPGDEFTDPFLFFEEPRNVIDLTVGATVLINQNLSVASGVSFPLTNNDTRGFEFLFYVSYGH